MTNPLPLRAIGSELRIILRTSPSIATLLMIAVFCCKQKPEPTTGFTKVLSSVTNINFENTLENTEDFNIIEYLYFYNGGGVAIQRSARYLLFV